MNEAPEKIYIFENPSTGTPDDRWLTTRSDDEDAEYVRADLIPDYFAGRLIYYDDISPETMRWVVYDGHRKIRFTSRRAAERWCAAESLKIHSEVIDRLMVAYLYADKAKQALEAAASLANGLREEIEFYALEIRRISDKIDTIIAQSCTKTKDSK